MSIVRFGMKFKPLSSFVLLAFLVCSSVAGFAHQSEDEVTPEVQQLYAQANAAQQSGNNVTAIEKYRTMIKLAPHLAAAYNNLGMLYFNEHDFVHAAEILERGLKLHQDMPTASAMLGMSYFQLGMDTKAEPYIYAAVKANPNDDQAQMALVRVQIKLGKYQEATLGLNHFLARNPNDQDAWYLLGKTYLQMSQDALKKINEIDPNSVVAHEIAGEIDESMHNYDVALVEYKKAIDLAPQRAGTHMHMANTYWLMGNWAAAQNEFKAELAIDPNNCTARWKLANAILEANGANETALSELNQSIERCPTLMQARVDRARALIRLGRQQEALPDLELALKESPNEPSIHFLLASVYKAAGKSAESQKEMQTYGRLQREASEAVAAQAAGAIVIKSNAQ
jgi:tetratricopeptide (TPR) repeat protein